MRVKIQTSPNTHEYQEVPDSPGFELLPGLPDPLPTPAGKLASGPEHIAAFRKLLETEIPPPEKAEGDGIVFVGGGRYWPMIVIALRMCRDVSDLPIQVWYRGSLEPVGRDDIAGLENIELIDSTKYPHRILGGWEAKGLALLNCGFERVLYLDADAYPVTDVMPLLNMATPDKPFVMWQDLPDHDKSVKWQAFGIDFAIGQKIPCIQGGQLAIHRKALWRGLVIFHWLNQRSDYSYTKMYGDQDAWRVALCATNTPFICLGRSPWLNPAFVFKIDGIQVLCHRPQGKIYGEPGDKKCPHLPGEDRVWAYRDRYLHIDGSPEKVFDRIYRKKLWGEGSGGGSRGAEAEAYLDLINGIIELSGVKDVVDLGCGDGYIAGLIRAETVIGIDCCRDHATAAPNGLHLDIDKDREQLPCGDIALLKDVVHHWPNDLIKDWLTWARSCGKWKHLILTFDYPNPRQGDIKLGGYGALDLNKEPMAELGLKGFSRFLHKEVALLGCYFNCEDNTLCLQAVNGRKPR